MQIAKLPSITSILISLAAVGLGAGAAHSSAAVVLKWNQVLQNTLAAPGNPVTPRSYAMMHIAMFDTVNGCL